MPIQRQHGLQRYTLTTLIKATAIATATLAAMVAIDMRYFIGEVHYRVRKCITNANNIYNSYLYHPYSNKVKQFKYT